MKSAEISIPDESFDSDIIGKQMGAAIRDLLYPDAFGIPSELFGSFINRSYPGIVRFIGRDYLARIGDDEFVGGVNIPFLDGSVTVRGQSSGAIIQWPNEVGYARDIQRIWKDKSARYKKIKSDPKWLLAAEHAGHVISYDNILRWLENQVRSYR